MKGAFLILVLATLGSGIEYNGLRVHFAYTDKDQGTKYFYSLPRTLSDAQAQGWVPTERPPGIMPELNLYCLPNSTRLVCLLFAPSGFVAGLQVAFPVETVADALKPERYFTRWSPPAIGSEPKRDFWTSTQYYVNEDYLKSGVPKISDGATIQAGGVWVPDVDGKTMMKIPLAEEDLIRTIPLYKKQACVPKMGNHYYYNVTKQLDCSQVIEPWYALMSNNGKLLGVGFQTYGSLPPGTEGDRRWYEPLSNERTLPLGSMPDAAECMLDLHEKYNALSFHIYYIDNPWDISCKK